MCQLLPIFSTPFSVDVLRGSPLAAKKALTFDDLRGLRIRMLRHANDATDQLRRVLKREEDIEVMDVQTFDFALFNEAAESGDVVITSGAWSGIHPGFIGIELDCPIEVPCFLAYPRNPAPHVQRFVDAYANVIEENAIQIAPGCQTPYSQMISGIPSPPTMNKGNNPSG